MGVLLCLYLSYDAEVNFVGTESYAFGFLFILCRGEDRLSS